MEPFTETYTSLLQMLFTHHEDRSTEDHVRICGVVKNRALELARQADEDVASCFTESQTAATIDACTPIYERIQRVIDEQDYEPCLRAGFFSAYYNMMYERLVTEVGQNAPHELVPLDCRLTTRGKDGVCIRDLSGRSGDYYGNCPSLHAAEWLQVGSNNPRHVLWIEGGATLNNDHGKMYYVGTGKSHDVNAATGRVSARLYRCTMCLKHALGQGITQFAFLNYGHDAGPALVYGSVPHHLAAMTVINTADDVLAAALV